MPNRMTNVQKPFSLLHYAKVNNLDPRRLLLTAPLLFSDFHYQLDEFTGTIVTADWTTTAASGTTFAYNAQRNGALRGATGAVDNATVVLYKPNVAYDSADNPSLFLRWRAPATVTGFGFELMWSDAKTDETLTSVSALTDVAEAVPTVGNGITDYAAILMNTDLALTTGAVIGDGTTGTVLGRRINPVWTPTGSGIIDMIISISAILSQFQIWDSGALVGEFSVANGPDSGTLVRPSFLWKSLDAATKQIDVLKFAVLSEENAT